MDLGSGVEHLVTAALSGASTFVAVVKTVVGPAVQPLRIRLQHLEEHIKHLESDVVKISDIERWKQSVVQGLRLDWESLRIDIERKQYDRGSSPNLSFEELRRRIERLEQERFVTSEEFSEFAREEGRQWTEINRSIGEMRGELKTRR